MAKERLRKGKDLWKEVGGETVEEPEMRGPLQKMIWQFVIRLSREPRAQHSWHLSRILLCSGEPSMPCRMFRSILGLSMPVTPSLNVAKPKMPTDIGMSTPTPEDRKNNLQSDPLRWTGTYVMISCVPHNNETLKIIFFDIYTLLLFFSIFGCTGSSLLHADFL